MEAQTLCRLSCTLDDVDMGGVVDTVKRVKLKPQDSDIVLARKVSFKVVFEFAFDIGFWSTVLRWGELLDFAANTADEVFKTKALLAVCIASWRFGSGVEDGAVV